VLDVWLTFFERMFYVSSIDVSALCAFSRMYCKGIEWSCSSTAEIVCRHQCAVAAQAVGSGDHRACRQSSYEGLGAP